MSFGRATRSGWLSEVITCTGFPLQFRSSVRNRSITKISPNRNRKMPDIPKDARSAGEPCAPACRRSVLRSEVTLIARPFRMQMPSDKQISRATRSARDRRPRTATRSQQSQQPEQRKQGDGVEASSAAVASYAGKHLTCEGQRSNGSQRVRRFAEGHLEWTGGCASHVGRHRLLGIPRRLTVCSR